MKDQLKREGSISVYPPIIRYNQNHIEKIWIPGKEDSKRYQQKANIYIHIPFCIRKCDFCSFTTFSYQKDIVEKYIATMKKEMEILSQKELLEKLNYHTIYIGGGTPSLLKSEYLEEIIQNVYDNFTINDHYEFTVELHPLTVTYEKMKMLKNMGVTRVSIGAQSFNDEILKLNGRTHLIKDFYNAYDIISEVGFNNINVDIISGLVGETQDTWEDSLDKLFALSPDNITLYRLSVYKGSKLDKHLQEEDFKKLKVTDQDEISMTEKFYARVLEEGYEISSSTHTFTKDKGKDNVFRISRFGGDELLGIGISANSFVNNTAYINTNSLEEYFARVDSGILPIKRACHMSDEEVLKRAYLFLFKTGSIDRENMRERYGVDPIEINTNGLKKMLEEGYITISDKEISISEEVYMYTDDIIRRYIMTEKELAMEKVLIHYKNLTIGKEKKHEEK